MTFKISIASDHAGFDLKSKLVRSLSSQYMIQDCGCNKSDSNVDYPDYTHKVVCNLVSNVSDFAILICKTGIGMSMSANRYSFVRAALCHNINSAKLSRHHNNANVLCLGSDFISQDFAINITIAFLSTKFEGSRHINRVDKFNSLGERLFFFD